MDEQASPENTLLVGTIVAPFGVRGQVKMRALTDHIDHLRRRIRTVYLGPKLIAHRLKDAFVHKPEFIVLTLDGVASREAAEALRGVDVSILSREAVPLDDDEYFLHDLPGMAVLLDDGQPLGTVRDYLQTGANDVLVVTRNGENGGEVLIPLIRDVVVELNIAERRVVIRPIPGLLD